MRKPEPTKLPRFAPRAPRCPPPGCSPPAPGGRGWPAWIADIVHKLLTGGAALATILRFLT